MVAKTIGELQEYIQTLNPVTVVDDEEVQLATKSFLDLYDQGHALAVF